MTGIGTFVIKQIPIWLILHNMEFREFAEIIDCTPTYLSRIIHGHARISRRLARDIERATNGDVKARDICDRFKDKPERAVI